MQAALALCGEDMIIIESKQEGFRRCGEAHSRAKTEWPDDRWTEEELATLMAEPMLTVVVEKKASKPTAAADLIAMAKQAETIEDLDKILEGETRATVLATIEARRQELGK